MERRRLPNDFPTSIDEDRTYLTEHETFLPFLYKTLLQALKETGHARDKVAIVVSIILAEMAKTGSKKIAHQRNSCTQDSK